MYDSIYPKKPAGKDSKEKRNNIKFYVLLPWYRKEKDQLSLLIVEVMNTFPRDA